MNILSEDQIKALRERYPKGCVVRLIQMIDDQAPPAGTKGKVMFVDDIGTIHIRWENGSSLGAIPGEDIIDIV